jgi:Tol biopolymer transport system component
MNVDGTNAHQLSSVNGSFPHWSSDGTRIIFHGEVNSGIWLIDPDGENETLLYRYGGYPAWSPDGKQIAYVHLSDWRIWVMDVNGENHRKLTDHSGLQPAWSADGSQIAYDGMEKKKSVIFVINQDGSGDHMVEKGGSHPDWPN